MSADVPVLVENLDCQFRLKNSIFTLRGAMSVCRVRLRDTGTRDSTVQRPQGLHRSCKSLWRTVLSLLVPKLPRSAAYNLAVPRRLPTIRERLREDRAPCRSMSACLRDDWPSCPVQS